MAEEEEKQQLKFKSTSSLQLHNQRPTISLPPRTSADSFFLNGPGFSPGPMTLVSSFFSETDPDSECRSFSQLLAGAISSPAAVKKDEVDGDGNGLNFRSKEDRPPGLNIGRGQSHNITTTTTAPSSSFMFTVPAGLSPATLLDSPGFFSYLQGQVGMGHQQILAQPSAQAAQGQPQMQIGSEYPPSSSAPLASSLTQTSAFTSNATMHEQLPPMVSDPRITSTETPDYSQFDERSNYSSITVDKPVEDGYNWRKYGQKHVKGSEYPRSYYKCTHPQCPVKKKVERSLDGQVTEIIYKGEHNHQRPQSNKRGKDAGKSSGNPNVQGNHDFASQFVSGSSNKVHERPVTDFYKNERNSSQATEEQLSSDEEEVDAETAATERDEDEPDQKRRITDVRVPEPPPSHRTVTEPRIIVQTTSEVDLLDDGYRWRKYGQKVVKGNPYPRSYYKCTTPGCGVRKHVERAATDPKAVITAYEGKHNHDVPASKNSSHNTANNNQLQLKSEGLGAEKHFQMNNSDFNNNRQQSAAVLRLKKEQIT